jgi:DNA polymerase-3 subunit beta
MQVKTQLNPRLLRACLLIAAKQDIRYYLNGVCIELEATETRYIATDGHKMLVLRDERESRLPPQAPARFIIPREAIEHMPTKFKEPTVGVDCWYDDTAPESTEGRLGVIFFKPIEGKFPEWRQVIPKGGEANGEQSNYNVDYMMTFQRAAKAAFGNNALPDFFPNGSGAGLVLIPGYTGFVGFLMPMRKDNIGKLPDWINSKAEEYAAKVKAEAEAKARAAEKAAAANAEAAAVAW